ncbi:hypothetical protein BST61_g54 [Cercospora zeina]
MQFIPRNTWDVLPFSENNNTTSICQTCGDAGHTEEQHAAIPKSDAKVTIKNMPPEMMLNILSNLAPRDIQRCRGVSTKFHDVVDDHQEQLLRDMPVQYEGLADAQYMAGHIQEPNPFTFVFWYLSKRGIWKSPDHTTWYSRQATVLWAANQSPAIYAACDDPGEDTVSPTVLLDLLDEIGDAMVQAYISTHCPDLTPKISDVSTVNELRAIFDRTVEGTNLSSEARKWRLRLDREEICQFYLDIKAFKEPKIPSQPPSARKYIDPHGLLRIPRSGDICLEIPKMFLTRIDHWKQSPETMHRVDYPANGFLWNSPKRDGRYTRLDLERFLGQELPDICLWGTYCVRSTWAREIIFQAEKGRTLTAWEKAGVLEDLYVF